MGGVCRLPYNLSWLYFPKMGNFNTIYFSHNGKYLIFICMRVIAKSTLREFWQKYPKSEQQLLAWHKHFSKAEYRNANEIRKVFSSADNVGNGRIVFNICRNDYRLIIQFNYKFQFAFVRFIGTHKEYDNIKDIKNI